MTRAEWTANGICLNRGLGSNFTETIDRRVSEASVSVAALVTRIVFRGAALEAGAPRIPGLPRQQT